MSLHRHLLRLADLLLPPACPLCHSSFPRAWNKPLCADCLDGFLPLPSARCPLCALPFQTPNSHAHLCGRCSVETPPYAAVYAVGLYEQNLRLAIQKLKFNARIALDRPLARLLCQQLENPRAFDLLLPVPLHRIRLQQRNYNQALLLARELGRNLGIAVDSTLLCRPLPTTPQQRLSAGARVQNLRGAFAVRRELAGERILLVDDIMTTGSTAAACSQQLLEAGAGRVEIAVVGRAALR